MPPWERPIAQLILRSPNGSTWGGASVTAAGGYLDNLGFYWNLPWLPEFTALNIQAVQAGKVAATDMVTINDLEFVAIILNYAAVCLAFA